MMDKKISSNSSFFFSFSSFNGSLIYFKKKKTRNSMITHSNCSLSLVVRNFYFVLSLFSIILLLLSSQSSSLKMVHFDQNFLYNVQKRFQNFIFFSTDAFAFFGVCMAEKTAVARNSTSCGNSMGICIFISA